MKRKIEAVALSALLMTASFIPSLIFGARAASRQTEAASAAQVKTMFLNVGKADAALLMLGEQRYLIDTGTEESVDAMLKALTGFSVTRLDGVIITHIDSDHVGGLKALLKSDISVDRLYAATFYNVKSLEKHPVYKQSEKRGVPLTWLNSGDVIAVNDTMRLVILGPLTQDETNENNNSLVIRLETAQGDMLFAGDMEVEEETALLHAGLIKSAAVLKVGHHGEDDASSEGFIYTVKPQIAVISTDSAVEPDTPDPKVIGRLWDIGAEVLLTQKATCCIQVTLQSGNAIGRSIDYGNP